VSGQAAGEPMPASDAFVAELRAQITGVDRELLAAVNRRLALVRRLHDHKQAHGIPLRDPEREASLLAGLAGENGGPLSAGGVGEFFEHLLDLTRRELHGG
jgi:chorismate mutase